MFGFALVPVSLAVGAAMDYSRAADTHVLLAAAADAAAISTVTRTALTLSAADAKTLATQIFNDRAGQAKLASGVAATITVQDDSRGRSTVVIFSGTVPTTLMRLAGWSTVPVAGNSHAYSAPPTYIDFYLLLDNTPSMGVAATTADIAAMENATMIAAGGAPGKRCAFACHITGSTTDNYALAKSKNIQLRIDVVRKATQQLMDTAKETKVVDGQYRMAINTFGSSCEMGWRKYTRITGLTDQLDTAKSDAATIDLMAIPYQGFNNDQCSDFNATMIAANFDIQPPGDGTRRDAPQKVLFLVSDGTSDSFNPISCTRAFPPGQFGRCQEPLNTSVCDLIKARGIRIAALYTTYLPIPSDGWWTAYIKPISSDIADKMRACASSDLFFEVSPSQGISEAMNELFKRSVLTARLSQ